ncbi:transcriptional protein SWT1 [Nephila pilipes]|uniref:Transcriptional protein SWT1 n=1 Tax=Nephila pilipes TaxID=299642 RepID=A0A8X6P2W8_NEPPI|nr:transcriptional protein SWT1 [Nephila pilipes]
MTVIQENIADDSIVFSDCGKASRFSPYFWLNMEEPAGKGFLPDGWIVKISKHYPDRVYYFNTLTGCSTWECPKLKYPGNKKPKHTSILSKEVTNDITKMYEPESPEFLHKKISSSVHFDNSKIIEFISDAKKDSVKRSEECDEISPGPSEEVSKFITPAIAVVTPVISENSVPVQQKVTCVKNKTSSQQQRNTPVTSVTKSQKSSAISKLGKTGATKLIKITSIQKLQRSSNCDKFEKTASSVKLPKVSEKTSSSKSLLNNNSQNTASVDKLQSTSEKTKNPLKNNKIKFSFLQKSAKLSSSKAVLCISKDRICKKKRLPVELSSCSKNNALQSKYARCARPSDVEKLEKCNKKIKISDFDKKQDKEPSPSSVAVESECEFSDMDYEMPSEIGDTVTSSTSTEINVGASTSRNSDTDSLDDIEMLDVSSGMTKELNVPSWFNINPLNSYYIVLDTNALISDLKYIDELKDTPVDGCGPPHFLIPWMALQELDKMKKVGKNVSPDVSKGAREAIRYLFSILKADHPRFHKQNPLEISDSQWGYTKNNDDLILEYCLKLQELIPREKLILLTNDRNLSNKAMACDVIVHDQYSLSLTLKPDLITKDQTEVAKTPKALKSEYTKSLSHHRSLRNKCEKDYKNCEMEIDTLMAKVRELLKDVISPFFEKEMDEAYEDAWNYFPVDRITLQGVFKGIIKYWRTVFSLLFQAKDKRLFELLLEKIKRPKGLVGDRKECLHNLTVIEDVFNLIKKKWPDNMVVPLAEIKQFKKLIEEVFLKLSNHEKSMSEVDSAMKETECNCILELFNHNWTVINHLCGAALDFCKIPHSLQYDTSAPVPPKEGFIRVMPELCRRLCQIKDLMEKMINAVEKGIVDTVVFKHLLHSLLELVPSLNIQAENINFGHLTPAMLERFCRSPENKIRIEEGYKQLLNYHTKLVPAVQTLIIMK